MLGTLGAAAAGFGGITDNLLGLLALAPLCAVYIDHLIQQLRLRILALSLAHAHAQTDAATSGVDYLLYESILRDHFRSNQTDPHDPGDTYSIEPYVMKETTLYVSLFVGIMGPLAWLVGMTPGLQALVMFASGIIGHHLSKNLDHMYRQKFAAIRRAELRMRPERITSALRAFDGDQNSK